MASPRQWWQFWFLVGIVFRCTYLKDACKTVEHAPLASIDLPPKDQPFFQGFHTTNPESKSIFDTSSSYHGDYVMEQSFLRVSRARGWHSPPLPAFRRSPRGSSPRPPAPNTPRAWSFNDGVGSLRAPFLFQKRTLYGCVLQCS